MIYDPTQYAQLNEKFGLLKKALDYETRIARYVAIVQGAQFLSCSLALIFAVVFDMTAMKFVVPATIMLASLAANELVGMLYQRAMKRRWKAESEYFEKSAALHEENSTKIYEFIKQIEAAKQLITGVSNTTIN